MPSSDTQWKKGQSGNLSGRAKGTTNLRQKEKFLAILMDGVESEWLTIVGEQIRLACAGDYNAAKLLFDHILPKQKAYVFEREKDDDFDLEGLDTPEKREAAREIMLEAKLKVNALCETLH